MGERTLISWANHTLNFWMGCTEISAGCKNCYAKTAMTRYGRDFSKVLRTKTWADAFKWQARAAAAGKVETVFTCSWSDFFHPYADAWRAEAWEVIRACPNLHFQILTKRAERMPRHLPPDWGEGYPNVWLGVSVESREYLWRLDYLRQVPARVRFVSAEPLLEDLELTPEQVAGIHQIIVGGESGSGFRPMDHEWPRRILELCRKQGIAFFFKQSAAPRTEMGTKLDDQEYKEYPLDLVAEAEALRAVQLPVAKPDPVLFRS